MSDRSSRLLLGTTLLVATLAALAALVAVPEAGAAADALGLVLVSLLVFPDLLDLGVRLYFRGAHREAGGGEGGALPDVAEIGLSPYQKRLHLRPFGLLVSIRDAADWIEDFLVAFEPFRDRTWVIDDGSDDDTARRVRQAGFHCVAGGRNRRKPGALRELLAGLPSSIETVMVLDPDVVIGGSPRRRIRDLEAVIFDFQRSGCAALTPRVGVRQDGLLARLQGLEYAMSLRIGRRSLADAAVGSGVAVYRRDALERALARHTLSVYAEDLECSLLLLADGERIYYEDRLEVITEAKRTWSGWFAQRVGWNYGFLRVYALRFSEVRRIAGRGPWAAYNYLVYLGGFGLLLHPLRILGVVAVALGLANGIDDLLGFAAVPELRLAQPGLVLVAWAQYTLLAAMGLAVAVPRGRRAALAPVVPLYFLYAVAHVVPVTVGYANWLAVRLVGRRLFRDHYGSDRELAGERWTDRRRREEEAA